MRWGPFPCCVARGRGPARREGGRVAAGRADEGACARGRRASEGSIPAPDRGTLGVCRCTAREPAPKPRSLTALVRMGYAASTLGVLFAGDGWSEDGVGLVRVP